jgi:putative hydrolase
MKNRLKILTHPGDKAPVEMKRIAAACEKAGTWMEVNNSHGHLDIDELKICAPYDVKFVISSDAHKPEKVGSYETALGRILEAGIDISRVVNIEKV